ncbi:hypothetical protein os1_28600 [Comamonadaceae bacterium OS-1]|nr:hypothetical protein os1_28600 [Comamonadaceae bacterium OS-1]
MKPIPFILAALVATAAFTSAQAQVSVNITLPGLVQIAPPAPRLERVPSPQVGQVWVPGSWQWNGRDYAWHGGYWQAARPDHSFTPGRWIRADGGWRWVDGSWRQAERREERHDDRHDRDDDHRGNGHCPPGQAKKGRC